MRFDEFVREYEKLWNTQDTEETPYKSKYDARALAETLLGQNGISDLERIKLKIMLGKNFNFTEQPADAETAFNEALAMWSSCAQGDLDVLVDLLLQLSLLSIQRMNFKSALSFAVFARHLCLNSEQRNEPMEILSNFHLARIFGGLGWRETSAFFCAQTLVGQWIHNAGSEKLADDHFNVSEHVGNISDLAVYFVNHGSMWTAEYLLQGALAAAEISGASPELAAKCHRDLGRFYRSRLEFARHVTESGENEAVTSWQEITSSAVLPASLAPELKLPVDVRDKRVPASIALESATTCRVSEAESATALEGAIVFNSSTDDRKFYVKPAVTLATEVHERAVARLVKINSGIVEKFMKAGFDQLSTCGGRDILTKREIFKLGLHFANQAMTFFKLDGWANDHLTVVQELSHLWRELAAAEAAAGESKKRLCSMLERRYTLLDGVVFQINPQIFSDFYKSFLYELGDICSELFELKDNDEDSGHNAVRYYELFVEAYGTSIPQFDLRSVLNAKLSAARLLMKLRGTKLQDQLEYNRKSLKLCEETLELVKDEADLKEAPETRLAREIVSLLPAKIAKITRALN